MAAKKKASGKSIPEAVRAERGTGKVVSFRIGLKAVAILDAYAAKTGESKSAIVAMLLHELGRDPGLLGDAPDLD